MLIGLVASRRYPWRVRLRVFWPVTFAAAALVGLLAYGVVSKGADTTLDEAVAKGQRPVAPMAALPWLHRDGTGSLSDYKGKVVVLNVWASWCEPCREEVPLLQRTHQQISSQGGVVLGVDTQDASAEATGFLRDLKATFPSLRDRDRSYGRRFGVLGYPETFLIDRSGRIAALRRFPVTQAWLDQHLPKLLAEKA
jgi:cytochrome c biogenesis protein CcmG/thiol:disulfide interchange protein DsbE